MSLTIGTLCSGIGLIDLGLEWAGLGPVTWQCEFLPERRAVLEHHWPQVKRYEDVRTIGTPEYVDIIAFGSPCKNLSSAGDRRGLDGPSSSLFWDCLGVVERVRPRWVIFENVASGASLWVDRVRGALERIEYQTIPIPIAASDLGAPHRRGRVFIIAHTDRNGSGAGIAANDSQEGWRDPAPDADEPGQPRDRTCAHEGRPGSLHGGWRAPQPDMVRVVHGRADRLDGARQRVAALGDSCVPQCAEVIGHIVRMLDNQ